MLPVNITWELRNVRIYHGGLFIVWFTKESMLIAVCTFIPVKRYDHDVYIMVASSTRARPIDFEHVEFT